MIIKISFVAVLLLVAIVCQESVEEIAIEEIAGEEISGKEIAESEPALETDSDEDNDDAEPILDTESDEDIDDSEPVLDTGSNCVCTTITFQDESKHPGKTAGDCLTRDSVKNEFFCYVNFNSGCPDKIRSSRANGLFASFEACKNRVETISKIQGDMVAMKNVMADMKNYIIRNERKIFMNYDRISDVNSSISNVNSTVERQSARINSMSEEVEQQETRNVNNIKRLNSMDTEMVDMRGKIVQHSDTISDFNSSLLYLYSYVNSYNTNNYYNRRYYIRNEENRG